jgi:hypothetical protein
LLCDNRIPAAAASGNYVIPPDVVGAGGYLLVSVEEMNPGDTGSYTIQYDP